VLADHGATVVLSRPLLARLRAGGYVARYGVSYLRAILEINRIVNEC
jgi:hypothetical protein